MLVTKWLMNYSKISILLIQNNNESQSSLVEMSGVSWSERNVIKPWSVIKTPCNQGQQNTELPSDVLRLIFFFCFSQAYASFLPSSFAILSSMSILQYFFFLQEQLGKPVYAPLLFGSSAAEDIWNMNKSVCMREHMWWRQKDAIKIWKIYTLLSVRSIKLLRISTSQMIIEFNDKLKVKNAPGWGSSSSLRQLVTRQEEAASKCTLNLDITKNLVKTLPSIETGWPQ